jgi:DNA polymerase-1
MNDPAEVLKRLTSAREAVYDVETDGLDRFNTKVIGQVWTFGPRPDDSFYIPLRHGGGANIEDPVAFERAVERTVARNPGIKIIMHHGSFDLWHSARNNVELTLSSNTKFEDTMINQYLINELSSSFALDECCIAMGTTPKKGDELYRHLANLYGGEPTRRAQMGNLHKTAGNDPIAVDYALGDGTSTWDLMVRQRVELEQQGLLRIWDIESRLIPVLHRMSKRGTRIDEARLEEVSRTVDRWIEEAAAKFPKDFNPKGQADLKAMFGHRDDIPFTAPSRRFPNGQPSYNKKWLATFPEGQKVMALREFKHLRDSFITPLKERHLYKGRVHPEYNQTRGEEYGTITGRMSSSNPNMQQVHKRNETLGRLFRSIFIPDEGMVWRNADYNQAEPRILAHYAECKVLIAGYLANPPIDAHMAVARAAFNAGAPGEDPAVTKAKRQRGKTINQLMLTGGGLAHMADEMGVSQSEAQIVRDQYFAAMPEIKTLQKQAQRVMQSRGYVKSLLGARSRLDDPRFAYKATNRLLQRGNAEVIKKSMVEIDEYFRSVGDHTHMLNNIHDDIAFQYLPENKAEIDRAIEIMEDFGPGRSVELLVPLTVDIGEGENWAIASYGPEKK